MNIFYAKAADMTFKEYSGKVLMKRILDINENGLHTE